MIDSTCATGLSRGGVGGQAAIDAPRFCIQDGTKDGVVSLEDTMDPEVVEQLRAMGQWAHGMLQSRYATHRKKGLRIIIFAGTRMFVLFE